MGFYGNITNVNNSTFVFDKIYANRKDMELHAEDDGVFVGRYVLVDYNLDNPHPGSEQQRLYQSTKRPEHFYFSQEDAGQTAIGDSIAMYYDEPYYIEDETGKTIINPKTNDPAYSHCIFKGQIIYTLTNNIYTYYQCVGEQSVVDYSSYPYTTISGVAKFTAATDQDTYYKNFQFDREEYGNVGRGYDSTVWQKTFSPTEGQKYVMLAELNSVVPTLDITADAPTLNPISPHFDADSTNVYYKLHMQPSWGFKIKENVEYVRATEYKEGVTYYYHNTVNNTYEPVSNVDEKTYSLYYIKIFKPSDEKASSLENNWDPVTKQNIRKGKYNYDSAIYYNKDGFNSEYRHVKSEEENINMVKIEPTGFSGQKYNTVHGSGVIKAEAKPDMLEFTFNMPAIGNTISQVWDLIYGQGELDDEEQEIYRRNRNIEWDNISGLRLIQENPDGSGYTYNKDKVETLAGCINSIHDLMGMIITQEEKLEDETEEDFKQRTSIENALINRIYYGHYEPERVNNDIPYKGYYIKEFVYDITDDGLTTENTIELKDFSQTEYYYLNNNNYYLETTGYHSGNKYYKLNLNPNINEYSEEYEINYKELYSEDYEPNKYYYKDNNNYILSAAKQPNENLEYYIVENGKEAEIIDSTKSQFFFPTADDEYYRANFATTELIPVTINNVTKYQGSGLFYRGTDPQTQELAYFPFVPGETPYQTPLVWFENFLVEFATDLKGNVIQVYEFDKGNTKGTDYTMIKFELNKYYYYHEDEEYSGYILLKELKDIDIEKVYYSFPQEEKFIPINLDFYRPDLYYYKEGNNYILGKENKKLTRQYYLINKPEPTSEVFYEPNKYYYKLNNEFILDDSKVLVEEHKPYYKEGVHLYVKSDSNKILTEGAKWNPAISEKPDGVVLGRRIEKPVWRELPGFSRTLNTIHGLILELNRLIKFEDNITRDTTTVQGCINKINDIIRNFGKLIPGQILIVDNYGRIASSPYTTNQDVKAKRYNFNYEELEFNNSDIEIELKEDQNEEGWLGIAIEDDQDKLNIGFEHKYNPIEEQLQNTNMNDVGDKFGIIKPVIDNTGHTIAIDKEIIQLPNGYKYIETDNGEPNKIEAQSSKDTFILKGDDAWLSSTASIIEDRAQIEFSHLYPNRTTDISAELDMNNISSDNITEEEKANKENKIILESVNLDETGHVTNKNFDTITLPYGYKYVKAEGEENNTITAENTQDTFVLIGDKNEENQWIKTSILTEGKGIKIEHDDPSEIVTRDLTNLSPNFGDSFSIEDWVFDSKGHKANMSTHTVKIPQGSLSVENEIKFDNFNTVADINFNPTTGEIILTRKDVGDFKLKEPEIKDTAEIEPINFTQDALGVALLKLQKQLNLLNADKTIKNSVDWKIAECEKDFDIRLENEINALNQRILQIILNKETEEIDSLNEVVEWITNENIPNGAIAMKEVIENLAQDNIVINSTLDNIKQEDVNLHSRCNTLDKEVKNLINLTAPYEEKIKSLDEKIQYLEDKIKALTGE